MYAHRSSVGPVDLAFTDRYGGVSALPAGSLDLAPSAVLSGAGEPADRDRNLALVLDDFAPGAELADLEQVHGREVVEVSRSAAGRGGRERGDALLTGWPGVVLLVRAADCVPVLLADPEAGVIGAAHAGRQGVVLDVVTACVQRMWERGAHDLTAWVGPHICGRCYEVHADLQADVIAVEPATRSTTSWGTPALDLGAGVRSQLERAGVTVVDVSTCTLESPGLHSFRRDGAAAGRAAGVIVRRS